MHIIVAVAIIGIIIAAGFFFMMGRVAFIITKLRRSPSYRKILIMKRNSYLRHRSRRCKTCNKEDNNEKR